MTRRCAKTPSQCAWLVRRGLGRQDRWCFCNTRRESGRSLAESIGDSGPSSFANASHTTHVMAGGERETLRAKRRASRGSGEWPRRIGIVISTESRLRLLLGVKNFRSSLPARLRGLPAERRAPFSQTFDITSTYSWQRGHPEQHPYSHRDAKLQLRTLASAAVSSTPAPSMRLPPAS